MCGICGIIQLHGEPRLVASPEALDTITDVMAHRGPNDRGTYISPGVALGVRRLSVIDVEGGHQPFSNEDGTVWAVQNGEIYNHDELRGSLVREGHRFRSRCDTETLPHLYERDGVALPERLRGMFGLAVWDDTRRRALLARDRLGIKPLYYAIAGDLLVFGSELKSVLASGLVSPALDYEAIDAYLSYGFVPAPRTPLAQVSKLPPGHVLTVEDGHVETAAYWHYPEQRPQPGTAEDELARELLRELDESVRLRMIADVPLGVMLSGGLDSSLIAALMARRTSVPIQTFSIGFREAGDTNELADARLVAERLGAEHHELELSMNDSVDLETLVWSMDEPIADLSSLGFHALSELASKHVTVALSGQGADELLGGYMKHKAAMLCAAWDRMPVPVRRAQAHMAHRAPGRLRRASRTLAAPDQVSRLVEMTGKLDPGLRPTLLRGPLAAQDGRAAHRVMASLLDRPGLASPLGETLATDAQLALVDLLLHYFDRASMYYSLEVRVPFLDHHLVEFCATIPDSYKVRRLRTKHILKLAAAGLVPDHIINKRKIGLFRPAVANWLQRQTDGAVREHLLDRDPACGEFLDIGRVRDLIAGQSSSRGPGNPHLVLAILMLEVWLSSYLPTALATARAPVHASG